MNMALARQRNRHLLRATVVLTLCLTLSGCIYLRLLRFKSHLDNFDRYVAIEQTETGMAFRFLEPLVRGDDLIFIAGAKPQQIDRLDDGAELWEWLFRKRAGASEGEAFVFPVVTRIEDGLLSGIEFNETILKAIPAPWIEELARRIGKLQIGRSDRSASVAAYADHPQAPPTPTMKSVMDTIGRPTSMRRDENGLPSSYNYTLVSYQPGKGENKGRFHLSLLLDKGDTTRPVAGYEIRVSRR